jgi:hypothetical protein
MARRSIILPISTGPLWGLHKETYPQAQMQGKEDKEQAVASDKGNLIEASHVDAAQPQEVEHHAINFNYKLLSRVSNIDAESSSAISPPKHTTKPGGGFIRVTCLLL